MYITTPRLVEIYEPIKQISAGYRHTLALTEKGVVYGFGSNRLNEMGLGDSNYASQQIFMSPLRMNHLEMHDIV
jgi:alpha-tubulin suppressor-like RCC1 family protein